MSLRTGPNPYVPHLPNARRSGRRGGDALAPVRPGLPGAGLAATLALLGLGLLAPAGCSWAAPPRAPARTAEVFWLDAPSGPTHGMPGSLAELTAALEPSIVALVVERTETPHGELRPPGTGLRSRAISESLGSGFVISREGYLLSAEALVAGARRIRAQLADGRRLGVQLVGRDSHSRLALLKLEGEGPFTPAPLGDSETSAVGEWVIAIGHSDERAESSDLVPDHTPSLAKGVISGRERRVANSLTKLIQTDLVLVDGYSGAPLIDMNGRVIGIVDRALQPEGSLGISFAIPIAEAKRVLGQLRDAGRVRHAWLGVQIQSLTPKLVDRMGLSSDRGALVSEVLPYTPADKAKILAGDVIVEFAGNQIEQSQDLPGAVAQLEPGAEVNLVVLRGGQRRKLTAVLGAQPEEPVVAQEPRSPKEDGNSWGFEAEVLTPELAQRFGLANDASGLVVTSIDPLGPADRSEFAPGDVLREGNGQRLRTAADLQRALAIPEPLFRVQRGSTTLFRVLQREPD